MTARTTPLCAALLFILAACANAQTLSFDARTYPTNVYSKTQWRADLNGDGREDLITESTSGGPASFNVLLSNGDGSYGPAQQYQIDTKVGNVFLTFGDFNRDGKLDVIATTGASNEFLEFLNNGDGALHLQAHYVQPVQVFNVVAADWNHDGKIDVLYTSHNSTTGEIHVLFGNGDGGFTVGPVSTSTWTFGHIFMGDVDGDGKADLITIDPGDQTDVAVFYGDGNGHFSVTTHYRDPNRVEYVAYDVDGDGKTDLIGVPWVANPNGPSNTLFAKLRVIYGNSSRTLVGNDLALDQCADPDTPPVVADFNGDGKPDIAAQTIPQCGPGGGGYNVRIYSGLGGRTFGSGENAYTYIGFFRSMLVLRGTNDTKPDIVVTPSDSPLRDVLLVNNTSGHFAGCQAPSAAIGIHVCSPAASANSPVPFSIGAAGQTEMRKVEVWVDGSKKLESLKNFSHYAFLDGSFALAGGAHNVTVYAAGWDNLLQKTTFSLTVGSGSGGCSQPSTATATVICSPANGTTVSSPVSVQARGGSSVNFMEVWVDGTKRFQTSGNSVSASLTLAAGAHHMNVYGKNGSTVLSKAMSDFTVK
jgi:hypothetical protein